MSLRCWSHVLPVLCSVSLLSGSWGFGAVDYRGSGAFSAPFMTRVQCCLVDCTLSDDVTARFFPPKCLYTKKCQSVHLVLPAFGFFFFFALKIFLAPALNCRWVGRSVLCCPPPCAPCPHLFSDRDITTCAASRSSQPSSGEEMVWRSFGLFPVGRGPCLQVAMSQEERSRGLLYQPLINMSLKENI